MHHELHRRVVVVEQQHTVEARPLGLRLGLGDDRGAGRARLAGVCGRHPQAGGQFRILVWWLLVFRSWLLADRAPRAAHGLGPAGDIIKRPSGRGPDSRKPLELQGSSSRSGKNRHSAPPSTLNDRDSIADNSRQMLRKFADSLSQNFKYRNRRSGQLPIGIFRMRRHGNATGAFFSRSQGRRCAHARARHHSSARGGRCRGRL